MRTHVDIVVELAAFDVCEAININKIIARTNKTLTIPRFVSSSLRRVMGNLLAIERENGSKVESGVDKMLEIHAAHPVE